jgi:putative methyltransferase (TIGR04325 family)
MNLKAVIKDWCPPILLKHWRLPVPPNFKSKQPGSKNFSETYSTWEEAARHSTGYEAQNILDRTLEATLKAKNGEAVFERDSALLDHPEYPFFLISCLLHIALQKGRKLNVLDFGGALGSSYFQIRKFLTGIQELHWSVVEQKKHVEYGKRYIEDNVLHFYYTIEECITHQEPDVVILSGVFSVLERPYEIIQKVVESDIEYVIVDRQPLSNWDHEEIAVVTVPPSIYNASFPYWFLSEKKFRDAWAEAYIMEAEDQDVALVSGENVMPRRRFFYSRRNRNEH